MKKLLALCSISLISFIAISQNVMTPELLWQLGRVSGVGISNEGDKVVYNVTIYDAVSNTGSSQLYTVPLTGGAATAIDSSEDLITDKNISPDGKYKLSHRSVKMLNTSGQDYYTDVDKSEVQIYDDLMYRMV